MLLVADKQYLEELLKQYNYSSSELIEILHHIQNKFGFINLEIAKFLSEKLKLPIAKIFSVVTFYNEFKIENQGKHVFKVCLGTACKVMNGQTLYEFLRKELNIGKNNKSNDGVFGLQRVYCFGACARAPVVEIDGKLYGPVSIDFLKSKIEEIKNELKSDNQK